jgi:hypothetical protein
MVAPDWRETSMASPVVSSRFTGSFSQLIDPV